MIVDRSKLGVVAVLVLVLVACLLLLFWRQIVATGDSGGGRVVVESRNTPGGASGVDSEGQQPGDSGVDGDEGQRVGGTPAGGEIRTREGGVMRLPEGVNEKQWAQATTTALDTLQNYVSTAMSMDSAYEDPYAGYREAGRRGLATPRLVAEQTSSPVSEPELDDWRALIRGGVRVDARLDESSVLLDETVALSIGRIVFFATVDATMTRPGGEARVDSDEYRFTLVPRDGGYAVDRVEVGGATSRDG